MKSRDDNNTINNKKYYYRKNDWNTVGLTLYYIPIRLP